MLTKSLFTLSAPIVFRIRQTSICLLMLLFLAGLTIACTTKSQATTNDMAMIAAVVPPASSGMENAVANENDEIRAASEPITNTCTTQPLITYTIAGQTITRRSELGILADPAENLRVCQESQTTNQITSASDIITSTCDTQPLITYTIAGQTITRRSELGILADPTENLQVCQGGQDNSQITSASYTIASTCETQPLITYTIAGQTITRRSELGILGDPAENLRVCIGGQDNSQITSVSYTDLSLCTNQPLITYWIAGQKITRRSELGILGNNACSSLLADVP